MKLRLELAHGSMRTVPAPGASAETPDDAPIEAFALVRVGLFEDGERRAWFGWPSVDELADARTEWSWRAFPELLHGLIEACAERTFTELEVRVPAEVQAHLRQSAPRSWQLMVQRTRLGQRGEAYQLTIEDGALVLSHRPSGVADARRLTSPLLELALALGQGGLFTAEESRILVELLRARWLHRRLPPGLRWNADEGTFELRDDPSHSMRETLDAGGLPIELTLEAPLRDAPLELDTRTGEGIPLGVVRASLRWLLDPARSSTSLFLDPSGELPRESG